jgi:hypothetical protein
MSHVEEIEAAVGEHNRLALIPVPLPDCQDFFQALYLSDCHTRHGG